MLRRRVGEAAGPHKNLKVLKDDEVRPVMGAMHGALGQRCNFCHVQGDFASDENPKKLMARKMIEMVNDDQREVPGRQGARHLLHLPPRQEHARRWCRRRLRLRAQ